MQAIYAFMLYLNMFLFGCAEETNQDDTAFKDPPVSTIDSTTNFDESDDGVDIQHYEVLFERPDLGVEIDVEDIGRNVDDTISPREAQEVVFNAYPDYNFGEDIMSGPEEVEGIWIDGYMMSATVEFDVIEVIVDAHSAEIVKVVIMEGFAAPRASACTVSGIASGTIYSQRDARWSATKLGNSSIWTIGDSGCYLTALAMAYHNLWGVSTTPSQLNTSAIAAGGFSAGSANLILGTVINSRGGPHSYTAVSMSSVASSICAGRSVVAFVTWGSGHKMLTYYYNGGSTSSMGSYMAADPWYGDRRSLSGYTATTWYAIY